MSSRHKPAKVKLEDAVKSCRAVVAEILAVKLAPAHPLAILHREDCAKLVKTIKRVQPFLEDLEDNRPPEPAEAEGVKALQVL